LEVGLHHATKQCFDHIDQNVLGIHLYTLNQAAPVLKILKRLERGPVKAAAAAV